MNYREEAYISIPMIATRYDKGGGGIKRLLVGGREVLNETPKLHILPADASLPEMPSRWTWKPGRPIEVTRDGSAVVVTANGKYRDAEGKFVYRIAPAGELDVTYDFTYLGPEVYAREVGFRFAVPPWMDTLTWKRRGEWTVYPPDHIGRNEGTAKAHSGLAPAAPPGHSYAQDDAPMGTNDFRSTKRRVEHASITDADGYGLYIESNGEQHLRAGVESDRIALFLNDWFGGTASRASEWHRNYGKGRLLKTGERLQGTMRLRVIPGEDEGH